MLKRFTLLSLLVLTALTVRGQAYLKESNNWYFGDNAGLRFYPNITRPGSNGNPAALNDARFLNASEGTCAMSDTAGNLLFYAGSETTFDADSKVFNRQHEIMPNGDGMIGGSSSTQNAIAVRKPGSFNEYYMFQVAQLENTAPDPEGFYYSKIDMRLDGGLGDVVDSVKNIPILSKACEKVSAVLHRNGRWVWIVGHELNTNRFIAVLLTENGVSQRVFSSVGIRHPVTGTDKNASRGALKISPNGNRIALAISAPIGGRGVTQVFRFNNLTGEISDPITMSVASTNTIGMYGVEFSPDNSKLYFSDRDHRKIYQYDLCAGTGDSASVVRSRVSINCTETPSQMQLGLNGRIYVAHLGGSEHVSYITFPNVGGTGCQYDEPGIQLASGTSNDRGLTNVNQSIFNKLNPSISYAKLCEDDVTEFAGEASCQGVVATFRWNFGDTASGAANTDNIQYPRHRFSKPGRYTVRVVIDAGNYVDTATEEVVITARPRGSIAGDRISCKVLTPYTFVKDTALYNPTITDYYWRISGISSPIGAGTIDSIFSGPEHQQILYPYDTNQQVSVRAVAYSTTTLGEKCPSDSATLSVVVHQVQGGQPQGLDTTCLVVGKPYSVSSPDSPRTKFRWLVSPTAGLDSISKNAAATANLYFSTPGRRTVRVDAYKDTAAGVQTCFTTSPSFTLYMAAPPGDSITIYGDSAICDEKQVLFRNIGGQPSSSYVWDLIQPSVEVLPVGFLGARDSVEARVGFNSSLMKYGDNIYFITAQEVSIDGCKGPVAKRMLFNSCVSVPNVVTQNNDGKNDAFFVPNVDRYNDNELSVYNSYGREVFSAKGYRNDLNTSSLVSGTYFYHFRIKVDGQDRIYKGWLEVLK